VTTTSRIPAVTDYLVTQCKASALLGANPVAPVRVIDGPAVTADTLAEPLHLWIGWDQATGSGAGADAVQMWPVLDHARTRDEEGTVVCTADAWSGDTTSKTQRDACAAIVAGVEVLLRGDPNAGGPGDASMGGLVLWSGVAGPFEWYPRQSPEGAGCACVFRVTYRARLVST
jgi:hypothetical protein